MGNIGKDGMPVDETCVAVNKSTGRVVAYAHGFDAEGDVRATVRQCVTGQKGSKIVDFMKDISIIKGPEAKKALQRGHA
jgi:hypothetical protein